MDDGSAGEPDLIGLVAAMIAVSLMPRRGVDRPRRGVDRPRRAFVYRWLQLPLYQQT